MVIIRLKQINVVNCTAIQSTFKFFQTVTNLSFYKHTKDHKTKKDETGTEPVENFKSTTSSSMGKTNENETELSDKLIKWAIQNNISHISFSKLLKALTEHGLEGLPNNSRALLKIKEEEIKVSSVPPGIYTHFGLEKNLKNLISNLTVKNLFNGTDIGLSIFIDNLPFSKFSSRGFWVILGSVEGFVNNVFFVGTYHGYSKPKNSNLFLSQFVTEAKHLCSEGLEINGVVYNVTIKRLICDAPAKAFVLNVKDFHAYSSCTKCNTVGLFSRKKMCFLERGTPKTDEDFQNDEMYLTATKTNLLEIPRFGVVSNVPLDYMHLVCLGVVQKILSIWMTDGKHWIPESSPSEVIKTLASAYPCEFPKKPKSLEMFSRWNGHAFREFLLYHGPVVLRNRLRKEYFNHFLLLHAACRLLCTEANPENIHLAREFLNSFVENYKKLYETENVTHNFHGLYHLADECASHGTLDGFSAFPFEKFLLKLRNSMERSKKWTIPQTILKQSYDSVFSRDLAKLTKDKYRVGKKLKISDDDRFKQFSHCERLSVRNFEIIPGSKGDKYVLLKNSKLVEVTSVLEKKEKSIKTHLIAGKEFSSVSNFHSEPFKCLHLNMYTVENLSDCIDSWPIDMIDKKCMAIPVDREKTVMIGLLDENF